MNQNELLTFAGDILALIGQRPRMISYLAKGATCDVWLVQSESDQTYALRIITEDERVIDGAMDKFLRNAVQKRGGRMGAFVLSSETDTVPLKGKRWGLDAYIKGTHPERGALPDRVCRQLGTTLAALHQVPVQGFGRLASIKAGVIIGEKPTPLKAVSQRFENPLPETWGDDFIHPVFSAIPECTDEIMARLATVSNVIKEHPAVVCHTDLHEKQMLCKDNRLEALIDFGGASILDRHWDLGSVYYFHGKDNFADLYDAYLAASGTVQAPAELVPSFSIAIAMHHASRARLPGKHHRLARAIEHIQRVIPG